MGLLRETTPAIDKKLQSDPMVYLVSEQVSREKPPVPSRSRELIVGCVGYIVSESQAKLTEFGCCGVAPKCWEEGPVAPRKGEEMCPQSKSIASWYRILRCLGGSHGTPSKPMASRLGLKRSQSPSMCCQEEQWRSPGMGT